MILVYFKARKKGCKLLTKINIPSAKGININLDPTTSMLSSQITQLKLSISVSLPFNASFSSLHIRFDFYNPLKKYK